jgi:site-specific DNA-methyltransferase (adenine-specific)
MKSLANTIYSCFKDKGEFSLKDAYSENSDKPKETVRARIYDNRLDLSMLGDASIDCILTDHPWLDKKSNKGGDRNFATYNCFRYTLDDFKEKARVLKDGCFLVEILPAENENNYDYLYQIKKYAEQCGLLYYSKVTWKKGNKLPAMFDIPPVARKNKIHQSELPLTLCPALNLKRNCILIELAHRNILKIRDRLAGSPFFREVFWKATPAPANLNG